MCESDVQGRSRLIGAMYKYSTRVCFPVYCGAISRNQNGEFQTFDTDSISSWSRLVFFIVEGITPSRTAVWVTAAVRLSAMNFIERFAGGCAVRYHIFSCGTTVSYVYCMMYNESTQCSWSTVQYEQSEYRYAVKNERRPNSPCVKWTGTNEFFFDAKHLRETRADFSFRGRFGYKRRLTHAKFLLREIRAVQCHIPG